MTRGKNDTFFCPLPWWHLSVEPTGKVYSCCNSITFPALGDLHTQSADEIWNGQELQDLRNSFLKGECPKQCIQCVKEESAGLISLRQVALTRFPISDDVINSPSPKYLGLRLDNLCNLSCRICHKGVSTSWYRDAAAFGEIIPNGLIEANPTPEARKEFFNFVSEYVEVLYLAGGEPFLSEKVIELLDALKAKNKQDIEILINTNFSVPKPYLKKMLLELSWFNKVFLNLSLDGLGARGELMRKGQNWSSVEESIRFARKMFPAIALKLAPTISMLNFHHLADFVLYMIENFSFHPRDFKLSLLSEPAYYQVGLLDSKILTEGIHKISKLKEKMVQDFGEAEAQTLNYQLETIIDAAKIPLSPADIERHRQDFIRVTHKLDDLRTEKFQDIFPELAFLFSEASCAK